MQCPYCKTILNDKTEFCSNCGQLIVDSKESKNATSSYWNSIEQETTRDNNIRVEAENKIISQRRAKRNKIFVSIVIALLCIVFTLFLISSQKSNKYNEAQALFESGNYYDAIEVYKELDSYKDSAAYVKKCEEQIQEEMYLSGYAEYENGNYKNALEIFESLGNYKDSQLLYEECWTLIMPDTNSPFEQDYWIIFTEGSRSDRIEASTINSTVSGDNLCIIWDRQLDINDSTGSSHCNQYYLNDNNEWESIGEYHRLSDFASNILASNLDVYDSSGTLILPKCSYEDVDWNLIEKYK